MEEKSFVYWLQGFVELGDGKPPSEPQWNMIKEHLALCFTKVTGAKPPIDGTPGAGKICGSDFPVIQSEEVRKIINDLNEGQTDPAQRLYC